MTITLHPRGPFSLVAAATFVEGFPGTQAERRPGALRYAWAVDGDWRIVQATLRQDDRGVHAELAGRPPNQLARRAARDLEQMLCLDVDGTGFAALGAFPAPARLAQLTAPQSGLTARKIDQLRTLAVAAQDGALTRAQLRAMSHQDALAHLQQLPGIGPFSAELILIRGVRHPDMLPHHDAASSRHSRRLQHHRQRDHPLDHRQLAALPCLGRAPAPSVREAETGEIAHGRRRSSPVKSPKP